MSADAMPEVASVLVVDDDRVVCTSCARILTDEGHQVATTESPREGLRIATELRPDVAIVDLKMPEIDGIEFLRRIKQISPATEVMIITGYAEIETAVQAMKLGAYDYVTKPFSPDQLIVAVAKLQQRRRLESENLTLRQQLAQRYRFDNLVGRSPRMQAVFRLLQRVAPTDSTVLIRGDSGTGKELVARAIHTNSRRSAGPFIAVDCGALSETVLESEMFGHVKGAFTGAVASRKGFFAVAHGGTLFLDEIGNVSLTVQTRLLRVLQEHEFKPVGSSQPVKVDFRLIAATNRDLEGMVARGEFREELYYRLNIVPVRLPPLCQRTEDIPDLAMVFLAKHRDGAGARVENIAPETLELLVQHAWPGNVRELENAIQRAMVLCTGDRLLPEHFPASVRCGGPGLQQRPPVSTWQELKQVKRRLVAAAVAEVERDFVRHALERNDGNATRAAEAVGMLRPNFQALMRRHDIRSGVLANGGTAPVYEP